MVKGILGVTLSVLLTSVCWAKDAKRSIASKDMSPVHSLAYTCTVGSETRVIQINRGQKHCNVQYNRNGDKKEIAHAEKSISFCERIFNTVRFNIEKHGHKCAEGDQALNQPNSNTTNRIAQQ